MEPDLSLFQTTAEEDDSLLQHSPIYDIATLSSAPLSISSSPLSLSSSIPTFSTKGNADSQAHRSVSSYSNKENLNKNETKLGVSNLSVEPQKMKRSKKAGGYNMRKSLAWDRAFFTEEGVLNDSELSMISGTICDRDSLCVTDGHEKELLPINSSTVCGSVHGDSLEEDRFNKLDSGCHPKNRNFTNSSIMKKDSVSGDGPGSVSKSSQKISSGHGLKKVVCKGDISPMASTSQKRLSNSGTRKILTRNSKIPKVQVSKKNTPVQSTTTHSAAGGSSLKSSGTPQPAARKRLSSNLPSNTKHASSSGKASFESTPKSIKSFADVGSDMTNSTLQMRSMMSHKAPHTTKESNLMENNSRQSLVSGVENVFKSSNGTSNITAMPHVSSDNAGLNRKNVQAQGIKPSGLRMPSPSLRFFSETKAPVSNTSSQIHSMPPKVPKPSIPISVDNKAADHNHGSKPTKISQGAPIVNLMGKSDACPQRTYKCPTSSIVAPQVHADANHAMRDKCNKQTVETRDPLSHENLKPTNDEHSRYDILDGFGKQCKDQVPASSKVKDKDSKDNVKISSHVEFEEESCKATIIPDKNRNRTADTSVLDGSCELYPEVQLNEMCDLNTEVTEVRSKLSCPEVQLNKVCEMNTEVRSQLSCPEVQLNELCEMSMEVQSQVLDDLESNSSVMNYDVTFESQLNLNGHQNCHMLASDSCPSSSFFDDNKTPRASTGCGLDQTKSEQIIEVQLDERSLLEDVTSSVKSNEVESDVPCCIGGVMAMQESIVNGGLTVNCNTDCNVVSQSNYELVEDECDMMSDSKLSNKKLSQSSEAQDEAIENHDIPKRSFINSQKYNNKDNCAVSLDVGRLSSHCTSTLSELSNEDPINYNHFSDQGEEGSQSSKYGIVDNRAFADDEPCTDFTEVAYTEVDKQHIAGESIINQEINNAGTVNDVYKIINNMEEIKDPIDMLSCLPENDDALQTTHLKFQSSAMRCKGQEVIAVADPETGVCPVDKHETPTSYELMKAESDSPGCNPSPRGPSNETPQHADDLTDKSTSDAECIKDEVAVMEQRTIDQKLIRPLPDAVPFSDEWLAAIESAGEEILTLKTGAVKHSPPDKSIPEPSPWSPVKRKTHQAIGPFDCTKYTNA